MAGFVAPSGKWRPKYDGRRLRPLSETHMPATGDEFLTFGPAATRLRLQYHHLHRLAARKLIPFRCAGHLKLVAVADLEVIRAAARVAGYLRDEVTELCAATT